MKLNKLLNKDQRQALSSFFISISVAWFVALFAAGSVDHNLAALTYVRYFVSMILYLGMALYVLKGDTL